MRSTCLAALADLEAVCAEPGDAADDRGARTSTPPTGSPFAVAAFLVFEALVIAVRDALGVGAAEMRARHTNLE